LTLDLSEFRDASLSGYELGSRGTELSQVCGRWQGDSIMVRKELGCVKKTS
jgi:hypothetical protein